MFLFFTAANQGVKDLLISVSEVFVTNRIDDTVDRTVHMSHLYGYHIEGVRPFIIDVK